MTVWRKGMLAVCIDDSPPCDGIGPSLALHEVYRVLEVCPETEDVGRGDGVGLKVLYSDIADYSCWDALRFRPAVTDNKSCDADFRALLKRPARKSVEA